MELVSLAVRIDSTSVKEAATDLDRLTSTGKRTEEAMDGVGRGGRRAGEGSRDAASGSNRARQAMDQQSNSARQLTQLVRQYAMVAAGAFSVRQIIQSADAWQGLQNRLRLVTNGQAELAAATNDVYEIAQRTNQSLDSVAQVYQRFAQNADALGLSQQKLAQLTETVGQTIAISGGTAESASGALMQFGQALASGVLRGEEFNSVFEGAPALMYALAEGMGVPIGQMRELAAEGRITSDVMVEALGKIRDSVGEQFGNRVITVGQAFTNLTNAVTRYIGEASQATGATNTLAGSIQWLADNMGKVVTIAGVMSTLAIPAVIRGLRAAISGLRALTATLAANPFGALVVGTTAAIAALTAFRDEIVLSKEDGVTLGDVYSSVWDTISKAASSAYGTLRQMFGNTDEVAKESSRTWGEMFLDLLEGWYGIVDDVIAGGVGMITALGSALKNLPDLFRYWFVSAVNGAVAVFEDGMNAIIRKFNDLAEKVGIDPIGLIMPTRFDTGDLQGFSEYGRRVAESFKEGFDSGARPLTALLDSIMEGAREAAQYRELMQRYANDGYPPIIKGASDAAKANEELSNGAKAAAEAVKNLGETLRQEWLTSLDDQIEALHTQNFELQDQIRNYGLAESEVMRLAAAEADEAASALSAARAKAILNGATAESIAAYDEEIAKLRDLANVRRMVSGSMARVEMQQAQDEYLREWERTNEQIGQSLTDALMRGFEDGASFAQNFKRTLINMFQTLVLRPIIQPIVTQAAGAVTGALGIGGSNGGMGMPPGIGNIFSQAGSWLSGMSFTTGASVGSIGLANAVGSVGGDAIGALIAGNAGWSGGAGAMGTLGAGLSAIGSAMPYIGMGVLAYSLLKDAFEGETRFGAGYMIDPATGQAVRTGGPSGGDENGAQTAKAISDTFAATERLAGLLGGSLAGLQFGAGLEISPEKGRSFVWSDWGQRPEDIDYKAGMVDLSGVTDGNAVAAEFAVELQRSIIRGLQMSQVDEHWREWIDQFDVAALDEAGVQSIMATIEALVQMREVATNMGMESLANATAQAQANLIGLSGGIDAFSSNLQTYYEGFYTEGERAANLTDALTRGLAEFGMELPNTRAEFRALVEAQDLATESGQRAYAALLGMSGAFAQLVAAADESTADLEAIARERESLELRWLQLTGNTAELRRRELAALDASNRAQQERIWALEDEIALREAATRSAEQWASSMQAAQANAEQFHAGFTRSIGDYLAQLRGTDAGLRSPQDQLAAAQADYTVQLAMARAGDRDALSGITQYADRLIQAGTGMYASGEGAQSIIDRIERDLAALPEQVTIEELMLEELRGIRAGVLEGDAALQAALEAGNAADIAAALAPHFGMLDASLDGLLSYGELSEALAGKATDAQIATLFAMSDLNFDGGISRLELALGGVRHDLTQILPSDLAALLEQSFASIDLDTSGLLTSAELQAALGGAATSADVQGIMSYLDTNMDGLISRQELANNGITNLRAEMGNMIAVMDAYSSVLGRAPEPGGFYHWMDELRAGNVTTDQLAEVIAWAAQQPGGELGGGTTTPGGGTVNPGTGAGGGGTTPTTPGLTASQRTARSWYTDIAGWSNPSTSDISYWAAIIDAQGAAEARRHWAYQMGIQYHNGVKLYARGGLAMPGWAIVGEEGPELVNFSQPGRVYTAQQTAKMLEPPTRAGGHGQGDTQVREELRRLQNLVAAQTDLIDKMLRHQAAVAPRVIAAGERTADATEQQARRAAKQEAIPT